MPASRSPASTPCSVSSTSTTLLNSIKLTRHFFTNPPGEAAGVPDDGPPIGLRRCQSASSRTLEVSAIRKTPRNRRLMTSHIAGVNPQVDLADNFLAGGAEASRLLLAWGLAVVASAALISAAGKVIPSLRAIS